MSYPKTDPIGFRVLKWIIAPLLAVSFLGFFITSGLRSSTRRSLCQKLAQERGYLEATYVPGRLGSGDRCICSKKQNPDGTIDQDNLISIMIN